MDPPYEKRRNPNSMTIKIDNEKIMENTLNSILLLGLRLSELEEDIIKNLLQFTIFRVKKREYPKTGHSLILRKDKDLLLQEFH